MDDLPATPDAHRDYVPVDAEFLAGLRLAFIRVGTGKVALAFNFDGAVSGIEADFPMTLAKVGRELERRAAGAELEVVAARDAVPAAVAG